jgi:hypothetical protein
MSRLRRKSAQFPRKRLTETELSIVARTRLSQKKQFARTWLKEARWRRYHYYVETCSDGKRIYLTRPAQLNKGVDFQVRVEGFRGGTRKRRSDRPSFRNVIRDLRRKVKQKPRLISHLFKAVCDVYDCKEPVRVIRRRPKVRSFTIGLPIDKILLVLKWLFIEQDITYWLGTGRNRLMCAIERRVFRMKHSCYD